MEASPTTPIHEALQCSMKFDSLQSLTPAKYGFQHANNISKTWETLKNWIKARTTDSTFSALQTLTS